jgi:uncharacterized protein YdhG (YjbR/CyaY superfamily)
LRKPRDGALVEIEADSNGEERMQYDVTTPEEYLAALDSDWRRATLAHLRRLIKQHAPELREGIAYKMLCYSDDAGIVFGLNAQKHYVSLYVGDTRKIDPADALLAGLDRGKGCIRFRKHIVVAETHIAKFIDRAAALRRAGMDIEC